MFASDNHRRHRLLSPFVPGRRCDPVHQLQRHGQRKYATRGANLARREDSLTRRPTHAARATGFGYSTFPE